MTLDSAGASPALAELQRRLSDLPSSDRLFNPYSPAHPGGDARLANFACYLADMLNRRPRALMLFEAPGYRGCALTGIPVTSERVMLRGVARWGLFGPGYQPTSGQPGGVAEMTATIVWGALEEMAPSPPLIWNAVPLHPRQPGLAQSNRSPSADERRMGLVFLREVLEMFEFEKFLGVGRVAQDALSTLGLPAIPLRHPSQGGKPEFLRGLREVYRA